MKRKAVITNRKSLLYFINRRNLFSGILLLLLFIFNDVHAQKLDTSINRVKTDFKIDLPLIGSVKARSTNEIGSSNWMIGCETLDRDYTDYDQYKDYLVPLGIKLLRMQGGWAKTEKVKGQYDFAWLDHIINDAVSKGLKPWLQTSYGNALYPGGGGVNLGAGMPLSKEALMGYDKWVTAMVTRYKDKVFDWEVWNEPNFGDNTVNTPEIAADFNIRTAQIIKKIQPNARISCLAMGHHHYDYIEVFLKHIAKKRKAHLFDNMTYHDYVYNPDANNHIIFEMRLLLDKYAPKIKLRQGENGAPSLNGFGRGALGDYDWTELSQAKWDTRRMLGNLGHDVESSLFAIIDMAYTNGPIRSLNVKGILQSDSTKKVIKPKIAYYSVQNVASVFDNTLERIKPLEPSYNIAGAGPDQHCYSKGTDRSLAVYGYRDKATKKQLYTIWIDDYIPLNTNETRQLTLSFTNADFDTPVYVDIITGGVYEIPASSWSKKGNTYTFKNIPVYDAPILIAEKSLIKISEVKTKDNH